MSSQNSTARENDETEQIEEDKEGTRQDPEIDTGHACINGRNGNIETPQCLSSDHSGDSLEDNCDASEGALIDKSENATVSQAYGGARPKTTRTNASDKGRLKNGDMIRTKLSENSEMKVKTCEPELLVDQSRTAITFNDISNLPKLESRPTHSDRSVRLNIPDISKEEVADADLTEDDCYIYTYKGGTAYLSADLPNSFFR